jgi:hypothetical protein
VSTSTVAIKNPTLLGTPGRLRSTEPARGFLTAHLVQWCVTVCHELTDRAWTREHEERETEETPEFLNEEGADVEILTDGGGD